MWGKLLEENIATFRCYDNISLAKCYVSPTPPSRTFAQERANKTVSSPADGRRKPTVCFCCRERLGTAKTLSAKKVVLRGNLSTNRAVSRRPAENERIPQDKQRFYLTMCVKKHSFRRAMHAIFCIKFICKYRIFIYN